MSPAYIDVTGVGTYDFYFTQVDTDGCESTSAKLIIIKNPKPSITIVPSDSFNCVKTQITLDASASSQGPSFSTPSWSGPSIVSGQTTLKPVIDKPGTYKLFIQNLVTTCKRTDSIIIKPFVPPAVGLPKNNVNVCDTSHFDLFNAIDNYTVGGHWIDSNNTGRLENGHFYNTVGAAEGIYKMTYKQDSVNANCPGGTATVSFQLIDYKNPGIPMPVSICNTNDTYDLFNAMTGYSATGVWTCPAFPSLVTGSLFKIKDVNEGFYRFTYKFQPAGLCATDTSSLTINVYGVKNTGTGSSVTICSDQTYSLFNAIGVADRGGVWSDESTSGRLSDSVFDPRGLTGGIFNFSYKFVGNPCPMSPANVNITTDMVAPIILCRDAVNLSVSSLDADYYEGDTRTDSSMIIAVSDNCGKYRLYNNLSNDSTLNGTRITRAVSQIEWTVVDSGRNEAKCKVNIKLINIPNIITPNGDQYNEIWDFSIENDYPDGVVVLYDRWGNKVWESDKGYHTKWTGGNAPSGTYRYVILDGKNVAVAGYVTLVR